MKGGTAPVSSAAGVSAPSQTASTGRSAPSAAAAIARATSAARAASGRTKIVTTASTASSASRIRSDRSYWPAVAEAIMFTGLPVDASGASPSASRARVAADGGSIRRPAASQASAQRIPGPPALVSTATRSPRGSGCRASRPATSNISPTVSARSTPAWANSASTVTSAAASSAPVRDDAARSPAAVWPLLTATTGLSLVILRTTRPKRRGLPNDVR